MFAKMERVNAIVVQVEPEVFLVVTTDPPTGLDIIPEIEKVVGGAPLTSKVRSDLIR
jgi:hypothetical protein